MVPLVIHVEDLQTGAVSKSAFIKSPVRIGRGELNDLPLPQGFVSQWHAVFQFDEHQVEYVDLGSTNGSVVGGARIERNVPVPIAPGTEIRIGSLKLTVSRRSTGEHRAPPRTMFAVKAATAFRLAAPGGAPSSDTQAAPPTPPAAPPPPGPVLDLPTEFRAAAMPSPPAAPQRSGPPAGGAPMLDLPTDFRRAVPPPAPSAPPPPHVSASPASSDLERLVTTFAESYLPASIRVRGFDDAQALLGRLAEALEAFARAFVEMRKGHEEFGKQMGIRTVHGDGPVQRARDARQLIAALLDPGQQGRASDLQTCFADYMVHQVALLNGVSEGAKAMLSRLSPEEIEAQAPGSLWPLKAQTLWRTYEERFRELAAEDGAISDALFGRAFAQAYTAILGHRGATGRDSDEEHDRTDDEAEDGNQSPPPKKGPQRRR